MKKTLLLSLTVLAGILNAQTTNNVSINPLIDLKKNSEKYNEKKKEPLDAQLYVNGNMRVQTIDNLDYNSDVKKRYKQLCWDPNTKYVYAKNIDLPYISSTVNYDDRTLDPDQYDKNNNTINIDVDPDQFFLFFTNISIKPGEGVPQDKVVGFKNVGSENTKGPLLGFYLGHDSDKYTFKSFYRFTDGYHLYYYDGTNIVDPEDSNAPDWAKNKPVWVASVYAVSNKYMYKLHKVAVKNFTAYWDGNGTGGKYGIELGKLIEGKTSENIEITSTENNEINATVKAKAN